MLGKQGSSGVGPDVNAKAAQPAEAYLVQWNLLSPRYRPMGQSTPINRDLVLADISFLIAGAAETGETISVVREAERIIQWNPDCGMSAGEVHETILRLAVERRVPVEIGR